MQKKTKNEERISQMRDYNKIMIWKWNNKLTLKN